MIKHAVAASLLLTLFACAAEQAAAPEASQEPAAEPAPPVVVDQAAAKPDAGHACQEADCRTAVIDPDPCKSAGGCNAVPPPAPPPPPPCADGAITKKQANGAFVTFHMGAAADGAEVRFPDGSHFQFANMFCRRVAWAGVKAVCHAGTWSIDQGAASGDLQCQADQNASWSDRKNRIETGYSP